MSISYRLMEALVLAVAASLIPLAIIALVMFVIH